MAPGGENPNQREICTRWRTGPKAVDADVYPSKPTVKRETGQKMRKISKTICISLQTA